MRLATTVFAALLFAASAGVPAAPFGTAFTYQGQLRDNAQPANGAYDLQFTPYALAASGARTAVLYVDGDNVPAVRTYERARFTRRAVHVQYAPGPRGAAG